MTITIYGIPNCDQIKKTLAWFSEAELAVVFHDYKKIGIAPGVVKGWANAVGWEPLVNRTGSTWRNLPDAVKASVTSTASAIPVLVSNPSLIKRPVVVAGDSVLVGYDPAAFATLAQKAGARR